MEWKRETRAIDLLREHEKNPRQISREEERQLRKSLDEFGQCQPLVINTDNTVIGGHQRLHILRSMGVKYVDVYVPEEALSERQVDELNIRLNRNTGRWDVDILANQWELDDLLSWGFTESELNVDIKVISSAEEEEAENQRLEPPAEPRTKPGDRYVLGGHVLYCGDSTLPEDVEALLDGAEPVLMVTDPPYGVNYDPSWRIKSGKGALATGKVKNDDKINWALAWSLFPGSVAYVWHAGWFAAEVQKSLTDAEFEIVSQIIWAKQNFALSRGDYHWQHEPCWYAIRKGSSHNWQGSRKESTLWEIANLGAFGKSGGEDERTAHSTQKPIDCMKRPIINNTSDEDMVYDPFSGSGTTLIAAEQVGRTAFCMELDPAYCDIIAERYQRHCQRNNKKLDMSLNGKRIEPWI